MLSGSGIRIFRIFGIDLELHWSWFILFGLITFFYSSFFYQGALIFQLLIGFLTALLLFGSLLLHELSHSLVAKHYGIAVPKIQFFILGGASLLTEEADTARKEFLISIVGPLSSVFIGFAVGALVFFSNPDYAGVILLPTFLNRILVYLSFINFLNAGFNMVPAFPLDGGRVLRSILWGIRKDQTKATRIAALVGKNVGYWGMLIAGVAITVFLENIWGGIWIIFLGQFIGRGAHEHWLFYLSKHARVRDILVSRKRHSQGVIGSITFTFPGMDISCSLDSTLQEATEMLKTHGLGALPVVENGAVIDALFANDILDFLKRNKI